LLFSYFLQPFDQNNLLLFEFFLDLFTGSFCFFRLLGFVDKYSVIEFKWSAVFFKFIVSKADSIDKEGKKSWSL
jgi:hypothetical protein